MLSADHFQAHSLAIGTKTHQVWQIPFQPSLLWDEWEAVLLPMLQQGKNCLILDLSQVNEISLGQVNILLQMLRLVHHNQGYLVLTQLAPEVYRELQSLRLDKVFDIFSTLAKALDEYRQVIPWYRP